MSGRVTAVFEGASLSSSPVYMTADPEAANYAEALLQRAEREEREHFVPRGADGTPVCRPVPVGGFIAIFTAEIVDADDEVGLRSLQRVIAHPRVVRTFLRNQLNGADSLEALLDGGGA